MKDLLAFYYGINAEQKIVLNGMEGWKQHNISYFTISSDQKEIIYLEQAALAYYLYENNYPQITVPVLNNQGELYTKYDDTYYMVLGVRDDSQPLSGDHGEKLALFHTIGSAYQYEPQTISSYGQWKALWIDKLTAFENKLESEASQYFNDYYRLLMDVFPYVIGISENAIQYMQESEQEVRFHVSDQGSITFRRYHEGVLNSVVWLKNLVYDHPARDLAEYIRVMLLQRENPYEKLRQFMHSYQQVRPISIFGWRLVYARLLFPVPIFDIMERGFYLQDYDKSYNELAKILKQQTLYEKRLSSFFEMAGLDHESLRIPVLHWL